MPRAVVGCDELEHIDFVNARHGPHDEALTIDARRPIELRLFIAQVGRGAPLSKTISIWVRELAIAGNVIAVLRSLVSITSPESPTNTYRPSRLWCNHPYLTQLDAQGDSLWESVP